MTAPPRSRALFSAVLLSAFLLAACGRGDRARADSGDRAAAACLAPCRLSVLSATTLARPLRAALDGRARELGMIVDHESGGSLELARRVTYLARAPDIIALADREVFPGLLMPAHATWYAAFARNRMVLAYTDRSRGATALDSSTWRRTLLSPGVRSARSDPNRDPMGYRTLLVFQLAERRWRDAGLAARLAKAAPERFMRPKSSELVGLLQAGEVDYIWTYESVARAAGLRALRLPDEIDLGSSADSARYAAVTVRVVGLTPRDTIEMRGAPIVYALTVPLAAPHRVEAERLAAWLLSPDGVRALRAAGLDALDAPILIGRDVPGEIAKLARPAPVLP